MNDQMTKNNTQTKIPYVLTIIDGFGYSETKQHNAIALANTPTWDAIWKNYPKTLIECSGKTVGLPDQQIGNSEVGHMNIGAGRIIYQDLTRIDHEIETGRFFENDVLTDLMHDTKLNYKLNTRHGLHVIGLVSDGGVHSHLRHYLALAELAKRHGINNIYVHAFLDGRDTPPQSALASLQELNEYLLTNNIGKIVSVIGRYYAMDRDKRWERTELAFNHLTNQLDASLLNKNFYVTKTLEAAIEQAYARGETDEFVKPTLICDRLESYKDYSIKPGDNLIFMNFRADRARQISHLLINENHHGCDINAIKVNKFVTLTEYEAGLTNNIVYRPQTHKNTLGEFLQNKGLTQLRIAETEKYAHVTFFFNGGHEQPFKNEDRVLIPSPKVATYDLKPEMSAFELTEQLCHHIESGKYDVIICNFANPDMVGHTGSLDATIKAIETIDKCLDSVVKSINKVSGHLLITADHGNAECMYNEQAKQPHTAHTKSLVPFVYVNSKYSNPETSKITVTKPEGRLEDIVPTLLHLMGYQAPPEMTGQILFKV